MRDETRAKTSVDKILDTIDAGLGVDVGHQTAGDTAYFSDDAGKCWRCDNSDDLLDVGLCVPCRDHLAGGGPDPKDKRSQSLRRSFGAAPEFRRNLFGTAAGRLPGPLCNWIATSSATPLDLGPDVGPDVGRAVIGDLVRRVEQRSSIDLIVHDESHWPLGHQPDAAGFRPIRLHAVELVENLVRQRGVGRVVDVLASRAYSEVSEGRFTDVVLVPSWSQVWREEDTRYVHFIVVLWCRCDPARLPVHLRPTVHGGLTFDAWQRKRRIGKWARLAELAGISDAVYDRFVSDTLLNGLPTRFPTVHEQMVGARRSDSARRIQIELMAAALAGRTVHVVGPNGTEVHQPDGSVELLPPGPLSGYRPSLMEVDGVPVDPEDWP